MTDRLEAVQQREHRDTRDLVDTGTKMSVSRRKKKRANVAIPRKTKSNRCFCTTILFKSQDWYSTGHGSHTPLQDAGNKPMMDLAQSLQAWYGRTQTWYEHVVGSIGADQEALTFAQRPSWYSRYLSRNRNRKRNSNRQLSVIVNIESDAETH